jgi:hypothetical protein
VWRDAGGGLRPGEVHLSGLCHATITPIGALAKVAQPKGASTALGHHRRPGGVRLPYGACGALLSVRLHRCTYPVRGAELTVDTARLKQYLLLSAVASDIIPMLPLGATSSGSPMHVLGRCGTNRRQCGKGCSSLI